MKITKLFFAATLALLLFSASSTHSQWVYVGGFSYSGTYPPSVSVVDANTVWVCGGYGVPLVYRSTNAGVNWTSAIGNLTLDQFCVWGIDANTAYVGDGGVALGAGGNAKVNKTTNGGVNWTLVLSTGGSYGFINGIVFSRTNPQVGVIESDPPNNTGTSYWVQLTTNGGTSWTLLQPPGISGAASAQNSVICIDASYFGYGINVAPARVTWTSNGGSSWTTSTLTGLTGVFTSAYTMSTDKIHGLATTATDLPNIGMTTNGGVSFSLVNIGSGISSPTLSVAKWVPGTNIIFVGGSILTANGIVKSIDGGATWHVMTTGGISAISHLDVYKEANNVIHAYAVAGDGSCLRLRDSTLFLGVNNNNSNVPSEYALEQNFPNPFNPSTTIKYALPRSSNVMLKIYDMLGNEVRTVVNEFKPAGSYSVNFDASSLSSGVYFYKIVAGDFTDAKKMTLVK
ncbi:MAG: T9SS type A sorting domain-containing protein [Ignavibacteria bacterium]|jgi:hypothetical protein